MSTANIRRAIDDHAEDSCNALDREIDSLATTLFAKAHERALLTAHTALNRAAVEKKAALALAQ
jgi:hypothetical protein